MARPKMCDFSDNGQQYTFSDIPATAGMVRLGQAVQTSITVQI
jgi:hypothetical protein